MKVKVIFVIIFVLGFFQLKAQKDSTNFIFSADSTIISKNTNNLKQNNPKVATLLSIFPGAGQAYNKQYWKIPIFYGALGYATYNFGLKNKQYNKYLNALQAKLNFEEDSIAYPLPIFSEDISTLTTSQLTQAKDKYRRSRDLSAVIFLAIYAFNIIDANVYAHLSDFDISEDLSISIKPEVIPIYAIKRNTIGVSFQFQF